MKVLQINTTLNTGSTGRIAEEIGQVFIKNEHESYIAFSRKGGSKSKSNLIKVGNKLDVYLHGLKTRLLDQHGFGSKFVTKNFIKQIDQIKPDVVGLHNLHGYYINIEILFKYLKKIQVPILWTFHDCWPFTGHCCYFESVSCEKWKDCCHECPLTSAYPSSYLIDNSKKNFRRKKELFNGLNKLKIVTPSNWLKKLVDQSFMSSYESTVIHNGIDINKFRPISNRNLLEEYKISKYKIILGVASIWNRRKGLKYFIELAEYLEEEFKIVLVGLPKQKNKGLPENIIGIERTENIDDLAALYSAADIFVNPTLTDNFPTTNIEALACGTPVITFNTGGSPEAIDCDTGIVVEKGNTLKLYQAILEVSTNREKYPQELCRKRAITFFNKEDRYQDYLQLYTDALYKD